MSRYKRQPVQRFHSHLIEDDLEKTFIRLKQKLDVLQQLSDIFGSSQDELMKQQLIQAKREVRNDIALLLQNGISILDIYSRIGEPLIKSQILGAKQALKLFEQKEEQQIIDLYKEDEWLYRRLKQFAPFMITQEERFDSASQYVNPSDLDLFQFSQEQSEFEGFPPAQSPRSFQPQRQPPRSFQQQQFSPRSQPDVAMRDIIQSASGQQMSDLREEPLIIRPAKQRRFRNRETEAIFQQQRQRQQQEEEKKQMSPITTSPVRIQQPVEEEKQQQRSPSEFMTPPVVQSEDIQQPEQQLAPVQLSPEQKQYDPETQQVIFNLLNDIQRLKTYQLYDEQFDDIARVLDTSRQLIDQNIAPKQVKEQAQNLIQTLVDTRQFEGMTISEQMRLLLNEKYQNALQQLSAKFESNQPEFINMTVELLKAMYNDVFDQLDKYTQQINQQLDPIKKTLFQDESIDLLTRNYILAIEMREDENGQIQFVFNEDEIPSDESGSLKKMSDAVLRLYQAISETIQDGDQKKQILDPMKQLYKIKDLFAEIPQPDRFDYENIAQGYYDLQRRLNDIKLSKYGYYLLFIDIVQNEDGSVAIQIRDSIKQGIKTMGDIATFQDVTNVFVGYFQRLFKNLQDTSEYFKKDVQNYFNQYIMTNLVPIVQQKEEVQQQVAENPLKQEPQKIQQEKRKGRPKRRVVIGASQRQNISPPAQTKRKKKQFKDVILQNIQQGIQQQTLQDIRNAIIAGRDKDATKNQLNLGTNKIKQIFTAIIDSLPDDNFKLQQLNLYQGVDHNRKNKNELSKLLQILDNIGQAL